jgi:mannosyl-oligosaccharide glucosidase
MIQKNSPEYFATLQALSDQTVFNTLHGISSISQSSPLYLATKNSYWTGPVWINMNYLVIKGLKLFYPEQDDLYTDIRQQVIDTVCGEWTRTGYFFENYIKGGGSFSYPFNGWTSLIALIISEEF